MTKPFTAVGDWSLTPLGNSGSQHVDTSVSTPIKSKRAEVLKLQLQRVRNSELLCGCYPTALPVCHLGSKLALKA